jgi:hypothetical protein
MSFFQQRQTPSIKVASMPVIATFSNYAEAQRAVDYLSDQKFPVENVAIVGSNLKMVEQVLGRLTWGRAALNGLAMGAWFGMLIGLLLGLFAQSARGWFALLLWGLFYGALFGLVFGLISYAFSGGQRDFISASQVLASTYDVTCGPERAAEAQALLAGMPASGATSSARDLGAPRNEPPPALGV